MAHYAFINENNIVTEVIVGKDEDDNADLPVGFADWEAWYADFKGQNCKRTSYNTIANTHTLDGTPFRGNYAGIGYTYDTDNDVFIAPKPYDSWIIDEDTWIWEPPTPMPDDGNMYMWNEDTQSWDLQE